MQKTKYALVLSGGGFKGAFQLGALNYLKEYWTAVTGEKQMHFDIIAGVSVGSLNGCMLSMNKLHELNTLWDLIAQNGVEEIYTSDLIDTTNRNELKIRLDYEQLKQRLFPEFQLKISFWQAIGLLLFKNRREPFFKETIATIAREAGTNFKYFKSLASNAPLLKKLRTLVNLDAIHPDTKFYSGFVSLEDGFYHSVVNSDFNNNDDFINAILASTAMPIVWEPVTEISTREQTFRQSVDGGVVNVNPLGDVIDLIAKDPDPESEYQIFIVNCNAGTVEPDTQAATYNIGQIALRALDEITIAEIFRNDLEFFIRINDMVLQSGDKPLYDFDFKTKKRTNKPLKAFRYTLIDPLPGVLGNTLLASRELIDSRIKHGWDRAAAAFHQKKPAFNHLYV
jgi:NTE family protein